MPNKARSNRNNTGIRLKRPQIKAFDDPNFLKLGVVLIAIGLIFYAVSFIFNFAGIIALRAGGGLGVIIVATYFLAKLFKNNNKPRKW